MALQPLDKAAYVQPQGRLGSLLAGAAVLTGLAVGLFGLHEWHSVSDSLSGSAADLARVGARSTSLFYRRFEGALVNVASELSSSGPSLDPGHARVVIGRTISSVTGLDRIVLLDEEGRIFADSSSTLPAPRAPMVPHASPPRTNRIEVDRPTIDRGTARWIVPMRLQVPGKAQGHDWALVATTSIESPWQLVGEMPLPPGWVMALQRDDGYLQGRWPAPTSSVLYDRPIEGPVGALLRDQPGQTAGSVAGSSPTTGEPRRYAFQRVADYPLTLFVSFPDDAIFDAWLERVRLPFSLFALVALGSLWVYRRLASQQARHTADLARRRERLEILHAMTTDSIAGLTADALVRRTLERLHLVFPGAHLVFSAIGPDGIATLADRVAPAVPGADLPARFTGAGETRQALTARQGEPVFHDPDGRETALPAQDSAIRAGASLDVTLSDAQESAGVLSVVAAAPLHWDEHHVELLRAVAAQLSLVLRHAAADRLRAEAERQLRSREALFSAVFNSSRDALFLGNIADGRVFDCNPRAVALFQAPSRDYILGRPGHALLRHPLSRAELAERLDRLDRGETVQEDLEFRTRQGRRFWAEMLATRLDLAGTRAYVVRVADITERKAAEDRIRYLAQHDDLTGLPNRAFLHQALTAAIERARRHDRRLALLFMDLDRFKLINDSFGHAVGDEVLQVTAQRLRTSLRAADTIARLGGDEFVVLVEDFANEADLAGISQKLLGACSQPFHRDGHEFALTVSVGLSTYPDDGKDIDTLFKAADSAMYRAKESGKNTYRFYSPQLNAHAFERLSLESALKRAASRGELRLYYQPKLEISTGTVTGAEALVRWEHPERGLLQPAQFVPLAEESGLIDEIGAWVLGEACRQGRAWRAQGLDDLVIAVNLSARQFLKGDVLGQVTRALAEADLDPEHLELELTESTVMSNPEVAATMLMDLTRLGVGIAIDDFGTGYSSLAQLKRFPVATLKIDRSFIQDLPDDPEASAITQAVLALARSLRLRVVAEGVEFPRQLVFLAAHGCDFAQGFCVARPMPAAEFEQFARAASRNGV